MRPQFHFTARRGWINDPHGITYRDGGYDVFYQYVPNQTVWGPNCHWGHARGADLFSLTELPVAIAPGDGDDGIWTGSIVRDDDGLRAFYTSVQQPDIGIGRIRTATPGDRELLSWQKGDVIIEAPSDLDIIAYRDPFVFGDASEWRMLVGAGLRDGTAAALEYTSTDLLNWTYAGIAAQRSTAEREPVWMGALWECPQLIDVDGRQVLVSSVWDDDVLYYAGYGVGSFDAGRFSATTWGRLTYGPSYYAPSFFRDAEGRPCLVFWMRHVDDVDEGWASAHSIPYVLSLSSGQLTATPHPDLERHLGAPLESNVVDGASFFVEWRPVDGNSTLEFRTDGAELLHLSIADGVLSAIAPAQSDPLTVPVTGSVAVIVDGPVVEIVSPAGLLGFPIDPAAAPVTIDGHGSPFSIRVWKGR